MSDEGSNPGLGGWLLFGLLGVGSLVLASVLGAVPDAFDRILEFDVNYSLIYWLPLRVLGTYLDVYGWSRFAMAIGAGLIVLYAAWRAVERLAPSRQPD